MEHASDLDDIRSQLGDVESQIQKIEKRVNPVKSRAPASAKAFDGAERRVDFIDDKCKDLYGRTDDSAFKECQRRVKSGIESHVEQSYRLTSAEWAKA